MKHFWLFIYNILFLPLFFIFVHFISLFNPKVRRALHRRKGLMEKLKLDVSVLDKNKKNILIQCSSLGEFQEAKPVISELNKSGNYNFIVSFFSPSGYDNLVRDSMYSLAPESNILKTFLPFDSYQRMKRFIELTSPYVVLLVKYDLWYNFLFLMDKIGIYSALINAKYSPGDIKWKPVFRSFYKTMYGFLNVIITADTDSVGKFKKIIKDPAIVNYGDTKIEYISRAVVEQTRDTLIPDYILKNKIMFAAGSTWQEDEDLLLPAVEKIYSNRNGIGFSLLTLLVPHEPFEETLMQIEEKISGLANISSIRFSRLKDYSDENLILVDNVGLLFSLYKYAAVAYVGGGLGTGLHNVLEPAAYGIPVIFGGRTISDDAAMLISKGSGIAVADTEELYTRLEELLCEKNKRTELGSRSESVFRNKFDTSKKIADLIEDSVTPLPPFVKGG